MLQPVQHLSLYKGHNLGSLCSLISVYVYIKDGILPSFLRTSGVGELRTLPLVMLLLTTQVQLPTSEGSTLAMYRFPVSWEIKRRVSCFTNEGYSLKIQENVRSVEKGIKKTCEIKLKLNLHRGQRVKLTLLLIKIISRENTENTRFVQVCQTGVDLMVQQVGGGVVQSPESYPLG